MAKRLSALDVTFVVFIALAMVAFVVSELKLMPEDGPPMDAQLSYYWSTVNLVAVGILGFGLLSALGLKSPGGIMLFLAALVGSATGLSEMSLLPVDWTQPLIVWLYPRSFPYGMLIFVCVGFLAAVAQLLSGRRGPERLSRLFFLGLFGVNGVVAVLATPILYAQMRHSHPAEKVKPLLCALLALPVISGMVLLYRAWASVQDGSARTTPAAAVGRLFIPFYSVYWMFIVLPGFATEYNRHLRQQNLGLRPLARGPMAAYCVLVLVGGIASAIATGVHIVAGLAIDAVLIAFGRKVFGDLCTAVNALPPGPAPPATAQVSTAPLPTV